MSDDSAAQDRVGELLLKAVRGLPADEQDEVLKGLLVGLMGREPSGPGTRPRRSDPFAIAARLRAGPPAERLLGLIEPDLQAVVAGESDLKVLPVRLPAVDYERLREWSRAHDFSMAVVIRTLVERFLAGRLPPGSGVSTG